MLPVYIIYVIYSIKLNELQNLSHRQTSNPRDTYNQ